MAKKKKKRNSLYLHTKIIARGEEGCLCMSFYCYKINKTRDGCLKGELTARHPLIVLDILQFDLMKNICILFHL